jgi:predicted PurR-regulated permease PerM
MTRIDYFRPASSPRDLSSITESATMTNLALIAVLTLVVLLLLYLFFMNCRSARLRTVVREVEAEVAAKLRREAEIAGAVIEQLTSGTPTDQVIANYQLDRAAVLTHDRTEKPWAWDKDDLADWRNRELVRRSEDVNRKLIVPALASCLVVLAVAAVAITVCYNYLAPQDFQSIPTQSSESQTTLPTPLPLPPSSPSLPISTPPEPTTPDANPIAGSKLGASPDSPETNASDSALPEPVSPSISDDAPQGASQ